MTQHPLSGITVVEFAGLAPGPFAGLVLADWGAIVIRIDRKDQRFSTDVLSRGKFSLAIDPKVPAGLDTLKRLLTKADVLIDPFRPGTMERLGLGPQVFLGNPGSHESGINHRLIYARICGFSPSGPQRSMAGHDLNYLAQSGVLSLMPPSRSGPSGTSPSFPLNILADFAGGGLTTALGILLALLERQRSGLGQIVENNMVDGARYVSSFPIIHSSDNPESPWFGRPVGDNFLDGGAPFYNVYLCKDNRYMSVACLEPQFYKTFLDTLLKTLSRSSPQFVREWENKGLIPRADNQMDRSGWGSTREFLEAAFLQLDRDSWANAFHDTDACAVPVLSLTEARSSAGVHANAQPSAHPLLSRTPAVDYGNIVGSNSEPVAACDVSSELCPGKHTISILRSFAGMSDSEIEYLIKKGAISHIDAFGTGESKL